MHTHSDLWQVEANGLGETPRVRDKAAPTGEVTYSTGCVLRILRKEDKLGSDKAASVNVINPAAIYELGVIYRAQGRIYVQPWESNGRMTLSLTVEGLVPADERSVDATGGGRTIGVQTSLGRRFGTIGDGTRRNWPESTKIWSRMSIWRRRPNDWVPGPAPSLILTELASVSGQIEALEAYRERMLVFARTLASETHSARKLAEGTGLSHSTIVRMATDEAIAEIVAEAGAIAADTLRDFDRRDDPQLFAAPGSSEDQK